MGKYRQNKIVDKTETKKVLSKHLEKALDAINNDMFTSFQDMFVSCTKVANAVVAGIRE